MSVSVRRRTRYAVIRQCSHELPDHLPTHLETPLQSEGIMIPHMPDPERRLAILSVAVPDREAALRDGAYQRRRGERRGDRDARDGGRAVTFAREDAESVAVTHAQVVYPDSRHLRHVPVARPPCFHPL